MDDNYRHGASLDEWMLFDVIMGLTEDLLPVVSNTKAVISAASKVKQLGKTPSMYNKRGEAAGIANWTSKMSTSAEVDAWSKVNDYGICLQTRRVRAIDIDVEDAYHAAAIMEVVAHYLPGAPLRWRANSGKCLIAFWYEGDLSKHVIPVEGGIIELLADGQQFIAAGEHVSGVRYEWSWSGGAGRVPELPGEAIHNMMGELELLFSTAPMRIAGARRRLSHLDGNVTPSNGTNPQMIDPTVAVLEARALSVGRDGELYIECPFKGEHTGDSGETATVYFPAGTRGYEAGHFKCLHAHCAGRSDEEFMEALDVIGAQFEVLGDDLATGVDGESTNLPTISSLKGLKCTKAGYLPILSNLERVIERFDILGERIAFDQFKGEVVTAAAGNDQPQWRQFDDEDYTRIRIWLEVNRFLPVGRELIRDIVNLVANKNKIDTAIEWISRIEWDGVRRVSNFLSDYMSAGCSDYTKNVSEYMWTALAGRVMCPGVKADIVPVLIGKQGAGKSYGVSEMSPHADFYTTVNLTERDDNLNRRMRGKLILEIAELRGLYSRDDESIKDFISHTHDRWVPKFQEKAKTYPRRALFIGTHNKKEFLADKTGNRRWAPIMVGLVDVEGIKNNRDQLWAEAKIMFEHAGVAFKGVESTFSAAHKEHRISDMMLETVSEWLYKKDSLSGVSPSEKKFFTIKDVFYDALGLDIKSSKRTDEIKIGDHLRELGFDKKDFRDGDRITKGWCLLK